LGRLSEVKKRAKVAALTSAAHSYLDKHNFATARELGTVLPQMIGFRAIREEMLKAVIKNINGSVTPSGRIVTILKREHAQPSIIIVAVDPQTLYNALGKYPGLSATYTGTISCGTVYPYLK